MIYPRTIASCVLQSLQTRLLIASISALFLVLFSNRASGAGYLHASGTRILDGANQPLLLRGVNLGNWLFNESYMTGAPFNNDTWPAGLKDVLGTDTNVAVFYATWRSNYVNQPDILRIKTLGFNSVRVPFDYKLFYDDVTGQDRDDGFLYFDNLLNWCASAGLYAIPDMHGVPGGQHDPGTFYFDPAKLTIASNIWRRIATHYATNTTIGGWDLVNEPFLDIASEKWRVRDAYVRLTAAIRQVDANHLIVVEGNYYGADLYDLDPRWDSNMAFSIHNYWTQLPTTGVFGIDAQVSLANAANVPLWLAEFGENSNPWNNAEKRSVESYSVGWAVWPYKISADSMKCVQWTPPTPGYQAVLNYWNGTGVKPVQSAALAGLLEMAQHTALAWCNENKDFVDALLRPDFHTNNIPFTVNTIPGRIYAAHYDMGNQGFAYSDAVYETTNVNTDAWNSGWIFRDDGVDVGYTADAGMHYYVGWIDSNEWLSFTIVSSAGVPSISLRYASMFGGRILIEVDGRNITDSLQLAATGGWDTWATTNVLANTNLLAGTHTMRVSFETGGLNLYWMDFSGMPPLRPADWLEYDIGEPVRLGYSFWNPASNVWTAAGGGADISRTVDQGHALMKNLNGDGTIMARVTSQQNTDANAKAGIMFRESEMTNSPYAYLFVAPNFVAFECRTNSGSTTLRTGTGPGRAPMWLRLTRVNDRFKAYTSTNGTLWQPFGSIVTIPMTSGQAGLAVTARNTNALSTATFDNFVINPGRAATLIPAGATWKYNDSGANLNTSWRGLTFNDSAWLAGPAQLGFGDGDEFTLIASNRQITTYFRQPFVVEDPNQFSNVVVRVLRDDGAVVYVNSNEVFRSNMPGGAILSSTPASLSVPAGDETTNYYSTNFSATLLISGTNILGVEVHQNNNVSTDLSFDLSLEAQFAAPQLSLTQTSSNIVFRWPAAGEFSLWSTVDLSTPITWTSLTNRPGLSSNIWSVPLPPPSAVRFYRLQSP